MGFDDVYRVGRWLRFRAGTCFGEAKDHLGLFIAISEEQAVCIAVNATSNVEGVKNYANRRQIDSSETIVVIEPGTRESSLHFGRETAFDCNRPSIVRREELIEWVNNRKIEIVDYNVEVNEGLLAKIKDGVLKSPLVSKRYKNIIER